MEKLPLRIPKNSKLPYFAVVCSVGMLILSFFYINIYVDGFDTSSIFGANTIFKFSNVFKLFNFFTFSNFLYLISKLVISILFIITFAFLAKKNSSFSIIIVSVTALLYFVNSIYNFIITGEIFNKNLFFLFQVLLILLLVILTVENKIKSKWPLVIYSFGLIILNITLTVFYKGSFVRQMYMSYIKTSHIINLSGLIYFVLLCLTIGILGLSLDNNPEKEYSSENAINYGNKNTIPPKLTEKNNIANTLKNNNEAVLQTNTLTKDPVNRLKEIAELHEQGILTDEEFDAKKKELLSEI